MKCLIVIQARTSSSRLPGKVLLPVSGLPAVVLAARRAGNTGNQVLVVTSDASSDDILSSILEKYDVPYFRGSLSLPLDRIVSALSGFEDRTLVVRLTADNMVPDGVLIDELKDYYLANDLEYLVCNGEESGLPYGVSVELTSLKHLREALLKVTDQFDLEHVTPYIRRTYGEVYYKKYKHLEMGNYRCTIDTFEDYLHVNRIFAETKDPESISFTELLAVMKNLPDGPIIDHTAKDLVIGGAQLGLNYGISNTKGKPDLEVVRQILGKGILNGVEYIDTARAYGESESIIGKALTPSQSSQIKVITKLSPLQKCTENSSPETVATYVKESVFESCYQLKAPFLQCLMLHRASHLTQWGGVVWDTLLELKKEGVIHSLGASVQNPDELMGVLNHQEIDFIQMPFNLLDYRWGEVIKKIKEIKSHRKMIVHVRSVLLQGLLTSSDKQLWKKANVSDHKDVLGWLQGLVNKGDFESVVDLCISYVRSQSWVDGLVIGMETEEQLEENIKIFGHPIINERKRLEIEASMPRLSLETLNPSSWRLQQ